ncbi:GRP family sugar transporter, partial [Leuconostoc mesenteroides]
MQGVLFALVPIFAWGSVGLVANKFGGDPNQQTLGMTLGAFVFALIVFLFRMPTLTWQIFLIGFIGGLLWA